MHPRLLFHLFTFSLALGELARHDEDEVLFLAMLSWCASILLVRQGAGRWRLILDGASAVLLLVAVASIMEVGRPLLVASVALSTVPLVLAVRARGGSELWSSIENWSTVEPRLIVVSVNDPDVGVARVTEWLRAEGFVRSEWNGTAAWQLGTRLMPPPEFVGIKLSATAITVEQWVGLNSGNQTLVKGTTFDGPIGRTLEDRLSRRQRAIAALLSDC